MSVNTGASSRYVGRKTEQDVARHLRQWWPQCVRQVRTGFRSHRFTSSDPGDLAGLPFACQVKGHKRNAPQFTPARARKLWTAPGGVVEQAAASGQNFGVMIEKRVGSADVDSWFAWVSFAPNWRDPQGLKRITVADLIELCRKTGLIPEREDSVDKTGG